MKIFFYKLLIFILASIFFLKTTNAELLNFDTEIKNCLISADHPENKTGGPSLDKLNAKEAIKNCNLALRQFPNSKEVLRSLSRVYYKKGDYKKAYKLALLSSKMGDAFSNWYLGIFFRDGKGVKKNLKKAFQYFKLSADQGFRFAQYSVGLSYFAGTLGQEKNKKKAFKYFKKAADQNHSMSLYFVGSIYSGGNGVNKDLEKSFEYLKRGAKENSLESKAALGIYYLNGEPSIGVEKDLKKAFEYFKEAADGNVIIKDIKNISLYEVAIAYEKGLGIKKNEKLALKYYKKAARNGHIKSNLLLGMILDKGIYDINSPEKARKYFEFVKNNANKDDNLIELQILYTYLARNSHYGINNPRNYKKAKELYEKANSYENFPPALDGLGDLYLLNQGVQKDFKKAFKHFQNSFELSNKLEKNSSFYLNEAAYKLGMMHFNGYGTSRDFEKAIFYFKIAGELGQPKAMEKLSEIYEFGIGTGKDQKEALYWLQELKNLDLNKLNTERYSTIGYILPNYSKLKSLKQKIKTLDQNKSSVGKFVAVMIGVSEYDNIINLKTPLKDINVISEILSSKYNFKIEKLINPSRQDITSKLSKIEKTLTKDDSLLIYYAGHGIEKDGFGYWLPKDAEIDDDSNWISNDYITKKIKFIKANNILVIADSCYSGTLTRGLKVNQNMNGRPSNFYLNTKSRMVISSGGVKPVLDGGGGGHSIFARMVINKLKSNAKPLISSQLYSSITEKVTKASANQNYKQIPNFASLPQSGHEEPDFVFIPK